jgi:hypothetical protein
VWRAGEGGAGGRAGRRRPSLDYGAPRQSRARILEWTSLFGEVEHKGQGANQTQSQDDREARDGEEVYDDAQDDESHDYALRDTHDSGGVAG